MTIEFRSSDDFVNYVNKLNPKGKEEQLAEAIRNNRLDFVKSYMNQKGGSVSPDKNLVLRVSIETGAIDFAVEIIRLKELTDIERLDDIKLAIKKGQVKTVTALLKLDPISGPVLNELLNLAVTENQLPILKLLLNRLTIPEKTLTGAISIAARNNNLEAFKELLAPHGFWAVFSSYFGINTLSKQVKTSALFDACRYGHLPIVEKLLRTWGLSAETRGDMLIKAVENNRLPIIQYFASNNIFIPQSKKDAAIKMAEDSGQFNILLPLLEYNHTSPEDSKGRTAICAANAGNIDTFRSFLPGSRIDIKLQQEAILNAVRNGHIDILQALLENFSISEEARGMAVVSAVYSDQLEALKLLLKNGPITEKARGSAAEAAVASEYQDHAFIEALVKNGPISQEIRAKILNDAQDNYNYTMSTLGLIYGVEGISKSKALKSSYEGKLKALLENGPTEELSKLRYKVIINSLYNRHNDIAALLSESISEEIRGNLVLEAVRDRSLLMLNFLTGSGAIALNKRVEALTEAASNGNRTFVHVLMNHADISQADKGRILIQAARNGHHEIVTDLLESGPITELALGHAFIFAASNGHRNVVIEMLRRGYISEERIDEAMGLAEANDHVVIVEILRQIRTALQRRHTPVHLFVNRQELKENPAMYLESACHGFDGIRFLNSDGTQQPGIDAGGLTKQFIHELFEHLRLKEVIHLDKERLPYSGSAGDVNYQNLGKLLSTVVHKNRGRSDPIYIGPVFNPETFELLKIYLDPSISETDKARAIAKQIKSFDDSTLIEFLVKDDPTDEEITSMKKHLEEVYMEEDDAYKSMALEDFYKICLNPFKSYENALKAMISGFSEELIGAIRTHGASFASVIQGSDKPTIEQLRAKLQISDDSVSKKRAWLLEKMEEELNKPSSTWINKFLTCVTGQPVLPAGNLIIRPSSDSLCRSHTCYCMIDVPVDEIGSPADEKDRFFERLDLLMASGLDYGLT